MRLVSGVPFSELIAGATTRTERLKLVPHLLAAADAIAFAHSRGVIHRDLKPSNIMVGDYGETIVIDWGLAKEIQENEDPTNQPYREPTDAELTRDGEVLGTPRYMSPEQAKGEPAGPPTDVYALGAILYELINGAALHTGATTAEILQNLRSTTNAPPIADGGPAELGAIALRALAPSPDRRYSTAKALAKDLRRYLDGQLVGSYPYSRWELLRRWVGRHKTAVATAIAGLVLTGLVAAGMFLQVLRERDRAESGFEKAQRERDEVVLTQAQGLLQTDPTEAIAWLKHYSGADTQRSQALASEAVARGAARQKLRSARLGPFEVRYVEPKNQLVGYWFDRRIRLIDFVRQTHEILAENVEPHFDLSADGAYLAYAKGRTLYAAPVAPGSPPTKVAENVRDFIFVGNDRLAVATDPGTLHIYAAPFRVPAWELKDESGPVTVLGAHADRGILAVGQGRNVMAIEDLHAPKGRVVGECTETIRFLRFSDNGSSLLAMCSANVIVWPLEGGTQFALQANSAIDAALSPNANRLAVATESGTIVAELATRKVQTLVEGSRQFRVAFAPTGDVLATGGADGTIHLVNLETGAHRELRGHRAPVTAHPQFRDGGATLITCDQAGECRIWSVAEWASRVVTVPTTVQRLIWLHDDAVLGSDVDGRLREWNSFGEVETTLLEEIGPIEDIAAVGSGQLAVSVGSRIDLYDREERLLSTVSTPDELNFLTASPDGTHLAAGGLKGVVSVWATRGGSLALRSSFTLGGEVNVLSFSPDGRSVAAAGQVESVLVAYIDGSREMHLDVDAEFADLDWLDGHRIVLAGLNNNVVGWNDRAGTVDTLDSHSAPVWKVASLGGQRWVSVSEDGSVRIGERDRSSTHYSDTRTWPLALETSSNGQLLAVGFADGTVRVWDLSSQRVATLTGHAGRIIRLSFNPACSLLVSTSTDNTVRFWKITFDASPPPENGGLADWLSTISSHTVQLAQPDHL